MGPKEPYIQSGPRSPMVEKGSPYSITECRVPELIPVLGSQPAGGASHNLAVGCHYFPPGLVTPTTLKRAATNLAAW